MPLYQCKKCKKVFPLAARIEVTDIEDLSPEFQGFQSVKKKKYTAVIKYCCPYCESIDLEEVQPVA